MSVSIGKLYNIIVFVLVLDGEKHVYDLDAVKPDRK